MGCATESPINESIDELLKKTGKSKRELASDLGITPQALRNKRAGRSDWKWSEITKLSTMADKTVDDFTGVNTQTVNCRR